jgi:hypothetical protein
VTPKAPTPPPDGPPDSPALDATIGRDIFTDQDRTEVRAVDEEITAGQAKRRRLDIERKTIEGMYCPCPGFAYNSLAGERNVLVSSLVLKDTLRADV